MTAKGAVKAPKMRRARVKTAEVLVGTPPRDRAAGTAEVEEMKMEAVHVSFEESKEAADVGIDEPKRPTDTGAKDAPENPRDNSVKVKKEPAEAACEGGTERPPHDEEVGSVKVKREPAGAEDGVSVVVRSSSSSPRVGDPAAPPEVGLSIDPRDASAWWAEAAARWRGITGNLKRKFGSDGELSDGGPVARRCSYSVGSRPPATPQRACSQSSDTSQPNHSPVPNDSPPSMRLNKDTKTCAICCGETEPWCAVVLRCQHGYYCSHCIQRHAEARLALGATSIACPECSTNLAERELRKLLPVELVERLLVRSLEQAVSSVSDLWPCPTPNCPMRVALGDDEEGRFRCPHCKRESCLRCGVRPFHKGLTCQQHAERGRRTQEIKSEESFKEWMQETGTKQCPTCRMAVTKQNIDGQQTQYQECHKMLCRNCKTRFCFKCTAVLTDTYTCGCSIDAHGFVDPTTGKRVEHLRTNKRRERAR